jgi:hypothetical protein
VKVTAPYRVRVVVNANFGERLCALPADEPIWIIDTPVNAPVAHRLWRERPAASYLSGITTFTPTSGGRPEDELLAQLDTIDLHHGRYSADPAYSLLEVIGCAASEPVRAALREMGFTIDSVASDGFTASKQHA